MQINPFQIVFFGFPLLLNVLAVLTFRKIFKVVALTILPLTLFAFIIDMISASQGGNLTGLFTILISGPAIVVLSLLGIADLLTREKPTLPVSTSTHVPSKALETNKHPFLGVARRIVRWAIAGGIVVGSLLFSLSYISVLFKLYPNQIPIVDIILLGAVIGAIGGACLACITNDREPASTKVKT